MQKQTLTWNTSCSLIPPSKFRPPIQWKINYICADLQCVRMRSRNDSLSEPEASSRSPPNAGFFLDEASALSSISTEWQESFTFRLGDLRRVESRFHILSVKCIVNSEGFRPCICLKVTGSSTADSRVLDDVCFCSNRGECQVYQDVMYARIFIVLSCLCESFGRACLGLYSFRASYLSCVALEYNNAAFSWLLWPERARRHLPSAMRKLVLRGKLCSSPWLLAYGRQPLVQREEYYIIIIHNNNSWPLHVYHFSSCIDCWTYDICYFHFIPIFTTRCS